MVNMRDNPVFNQACAMSSVSRSPSVTAAIRALYALGASRGAREPVPRDPLSAWLLEHDQTLRPGVTPASMLAMLGVRHRLVGEALARCVGPRTHVVALGCGFDTRWAAVGDRVAHWTLVDEAPVLETLERWMPQSESARRWGRVERVTADPLTWSATLRPGAVVLVEGLAMRFGLEGLMQRLGGLTQVPGVRVIADVHGSSVDVVSGGNSRHPAHWLWPREAGVARLRASQLRAQGWIVEQDDWHSGRLEVRGRGGLVFAPGVDPLRILQLRVR